MAKNNIPIRNVSTGTFFKVTFRKLLIDVLISLILVWVIFTKVFLVKMALMNESPSAKIIDIVLNVVIYCIILYPLSCFISLLMFRGERK